MYFPPGPRISRGDGGAGSAGAPTLRLVLQRLDHVVVAVADLEAATRDTEALLGRPPAWRGSNPGQGTANALFPLANCYLELLSPEGGGGLGARVARLLETRGEGVLALAFGTDDAAACADWLRGRGLAAADPVEGEGRDAISNALRRWRNVWLPLEATRGVGLFAIEHVEGQLPDSPPAGPAESAVAALDHVVVTSADLARARSLYAEQLGLRLALERDFEARGLRILFFRVGGATLEVVGRLAAAPDPAAEDRFGGLAWQVPDAEAARGRLAEAGFDVSAVRPGAKPGTRVLTVRDRSCGVPTLLIEPAARLPSAARGR
jgi:catechol 2,3-dioxygenase-like lactoylglutathione lyase family enzyme